MNQYTINFATISQSNSLWAWAGFIEKPSLDGKKWYVSRDPQNPNQYVKSADVKAKMTALEIIDKMNDLVKLPNDSQSLSNTFQFLIRFKKNLEGKYYAGLTGRILKIISYIFSRYSFKNSLVGKKISNFDTALNKKIWERSGFDSSIKELEKKAKTINELLKGSNKKDVLEKLEVYLEKFCKRVALSLEKSLKDLQSINPNDELRLAWYWDTLELLYHNEENLPILEEMFRFLPDAFHDRHTALMNEMGHYQAKEDYKKIVESQSLIKSLQQSSPSSSVSSSSAHPKKDLLNFAAERKINFSREQEKELVAFYEKLKETNSSYEPVYADFLENKSNRIASLAAFIKNIQKLHTPDCKIEIPQFLKQYLVSQ